MKKAILGVSLLASSYVFGDCSDTNCESVTIDQLAVPNSGNILVYTSGNEMNLSSCSNSYIELYSNEPNFNHMYSALLARQSSAKPVKVWIDGSVCKITRVQTKD